MDLTPFLPLITGAIGGAASSGVFRGPVQTLQDWWYINYGHELSDEAAMLKAKQEAQVQNLQASLLKNVSEIKPENIQEPKLNILGPALEASRFYIEEEDLREMFAKLIASSMDAGKNSQIHPSFVEVIKQLSGEDALFLKEFQKQSRLPYGKVLIVEDKENTPEKEIEDSNGFMKLPDLPSWEEFNRQNTVKSQPYINHFYYSENREHIYQNDFNISSLERLGLIKISQEAQLSISSVYSEIERNFNSMRTFMENDEYRKKQIPVGFHLELIKGVIDLTTFGINFFSVCI